MATREEKVRKKIERAKNRKSIRDLKYKEFLQNKTKEIDLGGFVFAKNGGIFWRNGKWMQKCSYEVYGICDYPCNGDC